jgi:hypothetical protein
VHGIYHCIFLRLLFGVVALSVVSLTHGGVNLYIHWENHSTTNMTAGIVLRYSLNGAMTSATTITASAVAGGVAAGGSANSGPHGVNTTNAFYVQGTSANGHKTTIAPVGGSPNGTYVADSVVLEWGDGPDEWYCTNSFTWRNQTLIPMTIVVQPHSTHLVDSSWPHLQTVAGMQSVSWSIVTTNDCLSYLQIDDLDGPYTTQIPPHSTSTNTYDLAKPAVNSTNILWAGSSTNLALDQTLKQGFETLYSAITEASQAEVAAMGGMSVTNINNLSFTNINNISNSVSVTVTNIGGSGTNDGLANATLIGISNMMARSGDGGAGLSNAAPWLFGSDPVADTMAKGNTDSASIQEQIGDAISIMGAFGKLGGLTVPDMNIESTWSLAPFEIDCNPMANGTLYQMAVWCKWFLEWLATFYFAYWCIKLPIEKLNELVKIPGIGAVGVVGTVTGSLVGMGAVIPMGILTFLGVFVAGASVVGGWFAEFATGHATYLAKLAVAPISQDSLPHIALYLFDAFVPWDYWLLLAEAALIWWLYVEAGYLAIVVAMKLLVKT